jgi:hypothetical protein
MSVLYIDQYGQKVADSDKELANKVDSFANLQSFKNAAAGKSGYTTEGINGKKVLILYHPVKALQTTWVVLDMQPLI